MKNDDLSSTNLMDHLNTLKKPWKFLAPMVGNSDEGYRILARKHGADLCYTEMVNSKVFNVNKCNPVLNQWYTTSKFDRPLVVQICGDCPETMAQTCASIHDYCDAIDINFGCPQEVAKRGHYGSFLQDEWVLILNIVRACVKSSKVPIFCKIRVFDSIDKTVEYAKIFENAGASLLTVHGRTREQKGLNTGLASWDHIKAVKNALKIPVIANGNIIYKEDIIKCYEYTNCDGIMSAETHLHNPTIFEQSITLSTTIYKEYLDITKDVLESRNLDDLYNCTIKPYIEIGSVKSHAFKIFSKIFKKLPDYREVLGKCKNLNDYYQFIEKIENLIKTDVLNLSDLEMEPNIRTTK